MNGFIDIVNGFSQSAIDALKVKADDLYLGGTTPPGDWVETPLPDTAFDVTAYGVPNNGSDGTSALETLASNTGVTNWYFPTGDYLIGQVDIPSHVVAVYGEGMITSKGYTGDTNPEGAFNLNNTGNNTADNFVMDGLGFAVGTGFDGGEAYGTLTLYQYGGDTSNIQIRNCSFDQSGHRMCSFKAFAESDGSMSHNGLRVYNNTITNLAGGISVELFNKENLDNSNGFVNTYVYSNIFTGTGGMAISMAGIRQNFYVYNNTFTDINWAIETAECDNGFVYNNYGTGLKTYSFTDSIKWGGPYVSPGVVKVHNNHFEGYPADHGGSFLLYNGGPTEVYNNYIRGVVFVKIDNFGGLDTNTVMGNIHNNTIVLDWVNDWSSRPILITDVSEGTFTDNDVYNTVSGKDGLLSTTTGQTYSDNNFYVNGGVCMNGDTQTGGSCDTSYTGITPTSRPGAGLLP